jgi:hypothetical protein
VGDREEAGPVEVDVGVEVIAVEVVEFRCPVAGYVLVDIMF